MTVIDFRLRPPTEEYKESFRGLGALFGNIAPDTYYNSSLEACIKEMEELDMVAVLMGRQAPPALAVSNDHIKKLVDDYPKRFIPFAGIDPAKRRVCQDEIDRIAKLGFKGVSFDHGFLEPPMLQNDKRLYPIYAQCEDLGLIVCLQCGPISGPDLSYASPLPVQQVAKDFPKLQILIAHGCWPFIDEVLAIMFSRPNVWLSPDSYLFRPGGHKYVEICNFSGSPMQDRCVYGSCYPFGPGIKARLQDWKKLPWDEAIMEKVLYNNGARLLGLES
ncbi:amidohydrolase family protein [Chloroflexota bacterium]